MCAGTIARQCLEVGLLDAVAIDLMPVARVVDARSSATCRWMTSRWATRLSSRDDITQNNSDIDIDSRYHLLNNDLERGHPILVRGKSMPIRVIQPAIGPALINTIAAGAIDTQALATGMQDEQMHRDLLARTPMGRAGKPEDIACAALYLAFPASSWVTGTILNVDGGSSVPAVQIPVPPLEPRPTR